jgi:hydroxymethylpyrimidine pyrophosphatase-like HAD family hydrolase
LPEQSILPEFPLKYCLDIVPYNKANAVEYFSAYINHLIGEQALALGYKRPTIELWACGDSGNDFPLMAFNAVTHVVMVGGASEELLRRAGRLRDCGKLVYTETQDERLGPSSILNALETL